MDRTLPCIFNYVKEKTVRSRAKATELEIINFVEFINGILFASSNIIWVKISAEFYERNCGC